MAAKSWRLSFIDIDSSFSVSTGGTTLYSYVVVRAPKGTAEPKYFEKGNEEAIKAMVGLPTANWPDIQEAIALNGSYDTYISAPAGSSKAYPSTYGGGYICKDGYHAFYNVTDYDEPNFLAAISIGNEDAFSYDESSLDAIFKEEDDKESDAGTSQDAIVLSVDSDMYAKMTRLDFTFWGAKAKKGLYSYNLNKSTMLLNPYVDGEINTSVVCGKIEQDTVNGTYKITLGGSVANNTVDNTDVPFIDFTTLVDYSAAITSKDDLTESNKALLKKLFLTGESTSVTVNSKVLTFSGSSVKARLTECINIRTSCYGYIIQVSPTEKPTAITISGVGYDKYRYDTQLNWVKADLASLTYDTYSKYLINNYVAYGASELKGIAYWNSDDKAFEDYTAKFNTKAVAIMKAANADSVTTVRKVYYVDGTSFLLKTVDGTGNQKLYENIAFNTFTFSCSEEVYPGVDTSGGTFTGSFSETGKDSYGTNIYWPNVISDDAMSFIKVVPVKTMDSDIDENGFFTGTKIVDEYAGIESVDLTLKGTRYITNLVQNNIDAGSLGCSWVDDFDTILSEGWTEALNSKYWETTLFVECTGNSCFASRLATLRTTQSLSTIIAPFIITQAILDNPDTVIVGGRSTGIGKYIGEFQVLDSYTGKKYWCQPIGDVGTNILKIIDKKLGACSPYGTNDSSGCGGVLSRTVLKSKWDISDTKQKLFDKKGLNPIVLDKSSGALTVMSGKTLQDPNNLTDWSYLAHSMAFDLCKREFYDNVMHPQIGKKNNSYYQNICKVRGDAILEKRTTGSDPAWTAAKLICDSTNNTDTVKANRDFAIKVQVKVTPFSETVTLTFENVGQSTVMS